MDLGAPLSEFPFIRVPLSCSVCPRRGAHRLARLATKFGAEIPIGELLDTLAADCPACGVRNRGGVVCGVRYTDLRGSPPPPNLPPAMMALRVLKSGKS